MNGNDIIRRMVVGVATLGMAVPQGLLHAEGGAKPTQPATRTVRAAVVPDIALTAGGTFSGRVVDHSGKVIEGAQVTVKQGKKEVGKTVTNKEGLYTFKNMKGGIYQVASGRTEGTFRIWAERTAPTAAKEHALLVMGENGARGQIGSIDPTLAILTGGVITAVVISAITLNEVQNFEPVVVEDPPTTTTSILPVSP